MNLFEADEQSILLEDLRFKLPGLVRTARDLSGFNDGQKTLILDWALIGVLDTYIYNRSKQSNYSKYNILLYSAEDKIEAAFMLKSAILTGSTIEEKHVKALSKGDLGKDIKAHFESLRPGVRLEDFLKQKMESAAEHKQSPQ